MPDIDAASIKSDKTGWSTHRGGFPRFASCSPQNLTRLPRAVSRVLNLPAICLSSWTDFDTQKQACNATASPNPDWQSSLIPYAFHKALLGPMAPSHPHTVRAAYLGRR